MKSGSLHSKTCLALLFTGAAMVSTSSLGASVCYNDSNKLVFNDTNIIGSGTVYLGGYNNGSWMWSSDNVCEAGSCTSVYDYTEGMVEFRLEGSGITDYYSPAAGTMHSAEIPVACSPTAPPSSGDTGNTPTSTNTATDTNTDTAQTPSGSSGACGDYGAHVSGSNIRLFYKDDPSWTGRSFVYLCKDGNCQTANLVDGYYENTVFSGSVGETFSFEFKIQDNASGQFMMEDTVTVSSSCDGGSSEPPATDTNTDTDTQTDTDTDTGSDTSSGLPAVPANGKQYFFLGQDQASIKEYMDTSGLPKPYGLTMYATLSRGESSYDGSYCFKGLDGLKNTNNYNSSEATGCSDNGHRQNHWGSGTQNVQWAIATYNPKVIAIGLWCPSNDRMPSLYQNNAYDDLLTEMADFFKANSSTSFMLRTCYEFNGDAGGWSAANFRETFKYVRNYLDNQNVKNVAHVWQSDAYHGTGRTTSALGNTEQGYWPGKRYVDWVGVSQFHSDIAEEAAIANAEGLPLFIAEATPHGALFHQYDFKLTFNSTGNSPDGSVTTHNDLNWFNQKDDEIYQNVTKAWHYINADWTAQPQWANAADQAGQNYFKYTDSRVQKNATIKSHFNSMVSTENGFILGD